MMMKMVHVCVLVEVSNLSKTRGSVCVCVCVWESVLWSDTSPVAVERCYVEHVAVSANSHRFHLTVSRQRGWVWWAAGTEDLQ